MTEAEEAEEAAAAAEAAEAEAIEPVEDPQLTALKELSAQLTLARRQLLKTNKDLEEKNAALAVQLANSKANPSARKGAALVLGLELESGLESSKRCRTPTIYNCPRFVFSPKDAQDKTPRKFQNNRDLARK